MDAANHSDLIGRLQDGTPYFAPLGELVWDPDEDRLQCHLCGGWFHFLGSSHLVRTHGWTLTQYRDAFQLRNNVPTCSRQMSAQHRAHTRQRIHADEFGARYLAAAADARGANTPRTPPRWRSLAVKHPELVDQLHPARNDRIDPVTIAAGSNRKLWWRCPHGHEWQATVHNRTAGWGCPTCAATAHAQRLRELARGQAVVPAERSLAVKHPELLAELHPTRNGQLDPYTIGYGSSKRKLWWRCLTCGHEWHASVASRTISGRGCRRCYLKRHAAQLATRNRERPPQIPLERSLAVKRPELLAELHPTRNGQLDAYAIAAGSHRRLWWRCPHGHEWQTTVNTRSRGCGCPTCATQRPQPRTPAGPTPTGRSTRFSLADCIDALREFIATFGEAPTVARYRAFAALADGRLPSPRTIRTHTASIGGWRVAIHRAAAIAETSDHSRSSARRGRGRADS